MFRRFVNGIIFGAGFGIAFAAVWIVSLSYILPEVMESKYKEPDFNNPKPAKVIQPEESKPATPVESGEYSFFKHTDRMKIPPGGGILAMSPMQKEIGDNRPRTYQLWLTQSELWQIRTVKDKVEIEKIPYPENASAETLYELMNEKLGIHAGQATMTVSGNEISRIKTDGKSPRNQTLNGKLSVTTEGVVFVLPNPYET